MADSFPSTDLPSPTLSARLRELADYLAAPATGRLTEEQRALSLGIARRLVADVAARLDPGIDAGALWHDWLRAGLPGAARLALPCYARAEEHRWRELSAQRGSAAAPPAEDFDAPAASDAIPPAESPSDSDRAYLALRIADRRRFDALGNPALAVADIDTELYRVLLLDIAGWRLAEVSADTARAAELGDAVRDALARQSGRGGIDRAAAAYRDSLGDEVRTAAATAIARHDWVALVALAAAATGRPYAEMALALLTAESAALPSLLAPLRLDRTAIAPLEASLAMLPARAVSGGAGAEDYAALLQARAEKIDPDEDGR